MQYLLIIVIIELIIIISICLSAQIYGIENYVSVSNSNHSKIKILTSFFPLYDFVKNIGGNKIELKSIIPLDTEPHHWEPTIQQIKEMYNADLIVYNGLGFEPWISKMQETLSINNTNLLNLSSIVLSSSENNSVTNLYSNNLTIDPHIWLDPVLVKSQIILIGQKLSEIDPKNIGYYLNNTNSYINKIDTLDNEIKNSISHCKYKDFITFHNAFNYFAKRYGLIPHPVFGTSPEGDILPKKLKEAVDLAKTLNITTFYTEDLADPRLTETLSSEVLNGKVLKLSPLERISENDLNSNVSYIIKMKQNLENLKLGLLCK